MSNSEVLEARASFQRLNMRQFNYSVLKVEDVQLRKFGNEFTKAEIFVKGHLEH